MTTERTVTSTYNAIYITTRKIEATKYELEYLDKALLDFKALNDGTEEHYMIRQMRRNNVYQIEEQIELLEARLADSEYLLKAQQGWYNEQAEESYRITFTSDLMNGTHTVKAITEEDAIAMVKAEVEAKGCKVETIYHEVRAEEQHEQQMKREDVQTKMDVRELIRLNASRTLIPHKEGNRVIYKDMGIVELVNNFMEDNDNDFNFVWAEVTSGGHQIVRKGNKYTYYEN